MMRHQASKLAYVALAFVLSVALPSGAAAATITFTTPVTPGGTPDLHVGDDIFTEAGFEVEAFWESGGVYIGGHFHNGVNNEAQHFNGAEQLQGFFIQKVGGGAFDLSALDFLVTGTSSVEGFSPSQVNVLLSTSYNPALGPAGQFTAVPISGSGTLAISGFTGISQIFITSSASVNFDNIVLDAAPAAVPEPGSLLLLGTGAAGLVARARRRRAARG